MSHARHFKAYTGNGDKPSNQKGPCESLEKSIATFTESPPDIAALNKLLREADAEWKKSAPVEQSKIKSPKRYYDC